MDKKEIAVDILIIVGGIVFSFFTKSLWFFGPTITAIGLLDLKTN